MTSYKYIIQLIQFRLQIMTKILANMKPTIFHFGSIKCTLMGHMLLIMSFSSTSFFIPNPIIDLSPLFHFQQEPFSNVMDIDIYIRILKPQIRTLIWVCYKFEPFSTSQFGCVIYNMNKLSHSTLSLLILYDFR